jgi:hypothetical protein
VPASGCKRASTLSDVRFDPLAQIFAVCGWLLGPMPGCTFFFAQRTRPMICATCLQTSRSSAHYRGQAKKNPRRLGATGGFISWRAGWHGLGGTLRLRFDTKPTHPTSPRSARIFRHQQTAGPDVSLILRTVSPAPAAWRYMSAMQPCLQMAVVWCRPHPTRGGACVRAAIQAPTRWRQQCRAGFRWYCAPRLRRKRQYCALPS